MIHIMLSAKSLTNLIRQGRTDRKFALARARTTGNESITLIAEKFSRSIMKAFHNRSQPVVDNMNLKRCLLSTGKAMIEMNNKINIISSKASMTSRVTMHSVEIARQMMGNECCAILNEIRTDEELESFSSCMTILMPRIEKKWIEFDNLLESRIRLFGFDAALLGTYSLIHSAQQLHFKQTNQKSAMKLLDIILEQRALLKATTLSANVYDVIHTIPTLGQLASNYSTPGDATEGSKVIATSGEECERVERMGMQLQLLAHALPRLKAKPIPIKHLLQDASDHFTSVLTGLRQPVPFTALRDVWKNASSVDLPNAYLFYKSLYEQVLASITHNPLQLVHQEEAVASLLESMVKAQFKDSRLILKITEVMDERGMDYHAVGIRAFASLVELGAVPFATKVLSGLVASSSDRIELIFSGSLKGVGTSLSGDAMDRVLRILCDDAETQAGHSDVRICEMKPVLPRLYTAPDLILALLCFNHCGERKRSGKLLQHIEQNVLKQMPSMSAMTVLSILHGYALAGRCFPDVLKVCDTVLQANLSAMTERQVSTVLWSYARLNHCNAELISQATNHFFASQSRLSALSHNGVAMLIRTLWSLAVLEKLEGGHLVHAEAALSKFMSTRPMWEGNVLTTSQMAQVACEVTTKERALIESGGADQEEVGRFLYFLEKHFPVRPPSHNELQEVRSSWSHRTFSKALNQMGVSHVNEKFLPEGYLVDIFIPPRKDHEGAADGVEDRGAVIELDGPTHFESYLKQPLGHTVMKNRHLKAAGYRVANVPYWENPQKVAEDQKMNAMQKVLKRVGVHHS